MRASLRTPASAAMAALTVLIAAVYLLSPVIQSGDGRLVVYESDSLLHQANTDLSEYGAIVNGFPCYPVGPRRISRYPWGTAFATAPLLAVAEAGGSLLGGSPTAHLREHPPRNLEKALASIIAALDCLLLMLLGRELTQRLAPALLLGVLYGFGTALWSTISRGLWQHGPLMLVTTMGLILLVRGRRVESWRTSALAGLPLGLGFAIRPTAAIAIAAVWALLLATDRRAARAYVLMAGVPILLTLGLNHHLYGTFLNPFYFHNGDGFLGTGLRPGFWTGLAGTMVSPARGLLIYSPFLLLIVFAALVRRRRPSGLELVCIAVFAVTWLSVSNTKDWPGGWSYGPRLMCDTLPFLAVLLLPVLDAVTRSPRTWSRPVAALAGVLALAFAWGAFVNARGALSWSTQVWNVRPVGASWDKEPQRFWDWGDPQFLRADHNTFKDIYPYDTPPDIPDDQACLIG